MKTSDILKYNLNQEMLSSIKEFSLYKNSFNVIVKTIYDIKKEDGEKSYSALELIKNVKDRCYDIVGLKDCKSIVDIFRYVHLIKQTKDKWEFVIIKYDINDITYEFVKEMIELDIKYENYLRKKKIEKILK